MMSWDRFLVWLNPWTWTNASRPKTATMASSSVTVKAARDAPIVLVKGVFMWSSGSKGEHTVEPLGAGTCRILKIDAVPDVGGAAIGFTPIRIVQIFLKLNAITFAECGRPMNRTA